MSKILLKSSNKKSVLGLLKKDNPNTSLFFKELKDFLIPYYIDSDVNSEIKNIIINIYSNPVIKKELLENIKKNKVISFLKKYY